MNVFKFFNVIFFISLSACSAEDNSLSVRLEKVGDDSIATTVSQEQDLSAKAKPSQAINKREKNDYVASVSTAVSNDAITQETIKPIQIAAPAETQITKQLGSNNIAAQARVSVSGPVMTSARFAIDWAGPRNSADYLIIISEDGKSRFDQRFIGGDDTALQTMLAPEKPGNYILNYEAAGTVYASTKLRVNKAIATVSLPDQVLTGAHFEVEWTGPKNDYDTLVLFSLDGKEKYDDAYVYREADQSPASLRAPEQVGEYAVHYYTNEGNTFTRDTFKVVQAKASIGIPKSATTGTHFEVHWTGPKNTYDTVAIFSLDGHKKYDDEYVYREADTSPSQLRAPEQVGEYAVHYYTNQGNTFARDTFRVVQAKATLNAPASITTGTHFEVEWLGPKNTYDTVAIFSMDGKEKYDDKYVYRESDVSPVQLRAPEQAGEYAVLYYTNQGNVFARDTIKVVPAKATLSVPDNVSIGEKFAVQWTGPKNTYDTLAIFDLQGKQKYGDKYIYRESDHSPTTLKAPEKTGEYAVHYYTNQGNTFARDTFWVGN